MDGFGMPMTLPHPDYGFFTALLLARCHSLQNPPVLGFKGVPASTMAPLHAAKFH